MKRSYLSLTLVTLSFSLAIGCNPSDDDDTVETTSPATAVTGALLGPGWSPSPELSAREPLAEEEARSSLWLMP